MFQFFVIRSLPDGKVPRPLFFYNYASISTFADFDEVLEDLLWILRARKWTYLGAPSCQSAGTAGILLPCCRPLDGV